MSEVILQQTRVDQGWPYWVRFVEAFPTIKHLADASEEEVLRLWQGLGYYSRARNLHATAKHVTYELKEFPNTYKEILKLKGVGPYTAAAIASICFDEPRPVVDGNVFRFASRYFGIQEDISKGGTRTIFEDLLTNEIPERHPGDFNQAMMEFGATVCAPKHILSHQKIFARFYRIQTEENDAHQISEKSDLKLYSTEEVLNLPKPKLIVNYLESIGIK